MSTLDPRTVMIAIPCYDGKIVAELAGSLISCQGLFGSISLPTGVSHVSLVRNLIAARFMASTFEWLVCIDSDIVPQRQDMELLLEPCDVKTVYLEDIEQGTRQKPPASIEVHPRPSRITTALVLDNPNGPRDVNLKMQGAADQLVCAQYPYKNDNLEPVSLGMGFVRIHRSVFEMLQQLKHPESERYVQVSEQLRKLQVTLEGYERAGDAEKATQIRDAITAVTENMPDRGDEPRLWQMSHQGRMFYDYFPSGPLLSSFVPTAEWKGEDHGFWTLCMLAGLVPRIETRTRLAHVGTKAYLYQGADVGGGQ